MQLEIDLSTTLLCVVASLVGLTLWFIQDDWTFGAVSVAYIFMMVGGDYVERWIRAQRTKGNFPIRYWEIYLTRYLRAFPIFVFVSALPLTNEQSSWQAIWLYVCCFLGLSIVGAIAALAAPYVRSR